MAYRRDLSGDEDDDDDETQALLSPKNKKSVEDGKLKQSCFEHFRTVVTVEPVLFLYFLSFYPLVPLTQQYVYAEFAKEYNLNSDAENTTCNANSNDSAYITTQHVQSKSSQWMIYYNLVGLLPAVVATLFVGQYSDKAGRKIPLILASVGGFFHAFLSLLIVYFDWSIDWLMVANFIDGSTGGISSAIIGSFSYVSDISSEKSRSVRIFILEVMIAIAAVIGTTVVGYLIKAIGFMYPFLILQGIQAINILIIIFYLKESVISKADSAPITLSHMKKTIVIYTKDDGSKRLRKLQIGLLIIFFCNMVDYGSSDVVTYYQLGMPLCFSSVQIGYYTATLFAAKIVGASVALKLFLRRFGDLKLILLGAISGTAGQVVAIFSINAIIMFMVPVASMCAWLILPLLRSFKTKRVKVDELGTMFAGIALAQQLSIIVGDVTLNTIYAHTLHIYRGFIFFVSTGLYLISLSMALTLLILENRGKVKYITIDEEIIN